MKNPLKSEVNDPMHQVQKKEEWEGKNYNNAEKKYKGIIFPRHTDWYRVKTDIKGDLTALGRSWPPYP